MDEMLRSAALQEGDNSEDPAGECSPIVLERAVIRDIILREGLFVYGDIAYYCRRHIVNPSGRDVSSADRRCIDWALHDARAVVAERERLNDDFFDEFIANDRTTDHPETTRGGAIDTSTDNILMLTAYTEDYSLGSICEEVNRNYALRHGYEFRSVVMPHEQMMECIVPKEHATWFKIHLLRIYLTDNALRQQLFEKRVKYLMWIDADALVMDHSIPVVPTFTAERGAGKDLIIAEDMNPGCLLNAGVFLLRCTNWSLRFLEEVWCMSHYDNVSYYEQSAITKLLRSHGEGLERYKPFHSYLPGASKETKYSAHVAVIPTEEFNSNVGVTLDDLLRYEPFLRTLLSSSEASVLQRRDELLNHIFCDNNPDIVAEEIVQAHAASNAGSKFGKLPAKFIYHPAGRKRKMILLYIMILKHRLPFNFKSSQVPMLQPYHFDDISTARTPGW